MDFLNPVFWIALVKVICLNVVLSGDNAVVIAMAARSLPEGQRRLAVIWGSAAAVVMLVLLTLFAVELLEFPWLKLLGAALLLWVGVQLLAEEEEDEDGGAKKHQTTLLGAIRVILVADLVMSTDNVLAVAGAAHGQVALVIAGLGISIPLIVFASSLLIGAMQRYPVIVTIGAALIGWVAGDMAWDEPVLKPYTNQVAEWANYAASALGALLVVGVGKFLQKKSLGAAQSDSGA